MSIRTQWRQVVASLDALEAEIRSAFLPQPSSRMCRLLIVAEDRRFGMHPGVDMLALCRAAWKTYFCNSRQGGSTIAMQLVRTLTGRYERTLIRKIVELLLAIRLSQHVPRDRLPLMYLWCAYYGWNMNNFKQACARLRFHPESATASEEAELIARLKYPQPQRQDAAWKIKVNRRELHIMTLYGSRLRRFAGHYLRMRNETV